MDQSAAILELAKQIGTQTAYLHWGYWLTLLALWAIVTAAAAYFGAYFKQAAEAKAINSKLDLIKSNLAATTQVTESIKSDFGMLDWRKREYESVRRAKLEELLIAAFECNNWVLELHSIETIYDEAFHRFGPSNKIEAIATLYFPELRQQVRTLVTFARSYQRASIDAVGAATQLKILAKATDAELIARRTELHEVHDASEIERTAARTKIYDTVDAIKKSASNLMDQALTPQVGATAIARSSTEAPTVIGG
jgi:hypothetical protein